MKYFIGVDGGGTGTRVRIIDEKNSIIGEAKGASSALVHGRSLAWTNIISTISQAFSDAKTTVPKLSECSVGMGLSGVNNHYWKNEFILLNPGFHQLVVESDGLTTLLGAHENRPGIIIALGTGSIGMSKDKNGNLKSVSGWGYPSGDEASGSWLGISALRYTEKVMDGRRVASPLSQDVQAHCGQDAKSLLKWLGSAGPKEFATLAPLIFQHSHHDQFARDLIDLAIKDIEEMLIALDSSFKLPFSLCGNLGMRFVDYLPQPLKSRHINPKGDSVDGALSLVRGNIL